MAHKIITFLFMALFSTLAVSTEWVFDGSEYKKLLSCNERAGQFLDWSNKVIDFDGSRDVGGLSVPDGEVQYEDRRRGYLAVLNWSKPQFNPSNNRVEMDLSSKNLRRNSTIRVGVRGYGRNGSNSRNYGGIIQALGSSIVTYSFAGPINSEIFELRVYISDGGLCSDPDVARYFFRNRSSFTR